MHATWSVSEPGTCAHALHDAVSVPHRSTTNLPPFLGSLLMSYCTYSKQVTEPTLGRGLGKRPMLFDFWRGTARLTRLSQPFYGCLNKLLLSDMRQLAYIPSAQRASLFRGISLPSVCPRLAPALHSLRTVDTKQFSTSEPLRATAESASGSPEPAAATPPQQPAPAATPSGAQSNEATQEPEADLRASWHALLQELHTHGYFGDVDEAG